MNFANYLAKMNSVDKLLENSESTNSFTSKKNILWKQINNRKLIKQLNNI